MDSITQRGFKEHVRTSLLHSGRGFDTDKLNHAENLYNSAVLHSGHTELKRAHLDDAIRHIEDHHEFKKLTPSQQEAFVSTLKKTLGVVEKSPGAANDSQFKKAA